MHTWKVHSCVGGCLDTCVQVCMWACMCVEEVHVCVHAYLCVQQGGLRRRVPSAHAEAAQKRAALHPQCLGGESVPILAGQLLAWHHTRAQHLRPLAV